MQKISDSRQESHPSGASNVCLVTGTYAVLPDRVPRQSKCQHTPLHGSARDFTPMQEFNGTNTVMAWEGPQAVRQHTSEHIAEPLLLPPSLSYSFGYQTSSAPFILDMPHATQTQTTLLFIAKFSKPLIINKNEFRELELMLSFCFSLQILNQSSP